MRQVKHIYSHWFPPMIGASAVTLGNIILYADPKENVPEWMYRHEMKHIEQIERLGLFGFYFQYFKEYLQGRREGLGHWDAYERISFEVEARKAER